MLYSCLVILEFKEKFKVFFPLNNFLSFYKGRWSERERREVCCLALIKKVVMNIRTEIGFWDRFH